MNTGSRHEKRTERQARLKLLTVWADGTVEKDDDGGEGRGGEVGRKGPGPRPRARTKKTREGKSWLEQQQAKSWGVGPATCQAPVDFGWGGGAWIHGAPVLDGSSTEYLIVPGARLYTTLPQLHKAYTLQQNGPQVVTRSWLGVPWLGCSLTDGRPPCWPGQMSLCASSMYPSGAGTGVSQARKAGREPTDLACKFSVNRSAAVSFVWTTRCFPLRFHLSPCGILKEKEKRKRRKRSHTYLTACLNRGGVWRTAAPAKQAGQRVSPATWPAHHVTAELGRPSACVHSICVRPASWDPESWARSEHVPRVQKQPWKEKKGGV